MKIFLIAQSPVGRSDPQIIYMANSFVAYGHEVHLFQCMHPSSHKMTDDLLDAAINVHSYTPPIPMWSRSAFWSYSYFVAKLIEEKSPDCVFSFDYAGILSMAQAKELNPKCSFQAFIFMLENVEYMLNSHGDQFLEVLKNIWSNAIVIYPEVNRLYFDINSCNSTLGLPKSLYLFPPTTPSHVATPLKNINLHSSVVRIIYAGSIVEQSYILDFAEKLVDSDIDFELEIYGPIGANCVDRINKISGDSNGFINYRGVINQRQLFDIYPNFDFSFIGWRPVSSNYYYACPNKFFQTLSHAVTPIVVPHPLINNIISQFDISCVRLSWDTSRWVNEIRNFYQSKDLYRNSTELNTLIFNKNLSWQNIFREFYNAHIV